jgi:hypothetical protein
MSSDVGGQLGHEYHHYLGVADCIQARIESKRSGSGEMIMEEEVQHRDHEF